MNTADPVCDVMSHIIEKRNEQEQEKEQRYIKPPFYCILFSFSFIEADPFFNMASSSSSTSIRLWVSA